MKDEEKVEVDLGFDFGSLAKDGLEEKDKWEQDSEPSTGVRAKGKYDRSRRVDNRVKDRMNLPTNVSAEPMGRPKEIFESDAEIIQEFFSQGMSVAEVARQMGVGLLTINKYIKEYPEIRKAAMVGNESAVGRVERSLYQRAIGGTIFEEKAVKLRDSDGSEHVKIVELETPVLPEVSAIKFFLTNRSKGIWVDKVETEVGGNITITFDKEDSEA
jgi:transposase-like protein